MTRKGLYLAFCTLLTLPAVGQHCAASISNACSGTTYEYIGNVTLGSLNNTSGCVATPAYSDFTAIAAPTIGIGVAMPVSVQVNNYWSADEVQIYCDWNGNNTFDLPGELTVIPDPVGPGGVGSTNQLYTGSITAPAGAVAIVRMRVVLYYDPANNGSPAQNPCTSSAVDSYGEIEDYSVNVAGGSAVPCSTSFTSSGPGQVTVTNNACAPLAGAAYFWAFTFAQGTFPNGGWFGLDIGIAQLVNWYLTGYPFTGTLDGAGASSFAAAGLPNMQVWEVTTLWAPGYGSFLTAYPPATHTIP
jgi:GEVED domain